MGMPSWSLLHILALANIVKEPLTFILIPLLLLIMHKLILLNMHLLLKGDSVLLFQPL